MEAWDQAVTAIVQASQIKPSATTKATVAVLAGALAKSAFHGKTLVPVKLSLTGTFVLLSTQLQSGFPILPRTCRRIFAKDRRKPWEPLTGRGKNTYTTINNMLNNILKMDGAQKLSKADQKSINGGRDSVGCWAGCNNKPNGTFCYYDYHCLCPGECISQSCFPY